MKSESGRLAVLGLLVLFYQSGVVAAQPTVEPTPPPRTVHAAYVLLAESPAGEKVALARVIVDLLAPCPDLLEAGGAAVATRPRRNPHGFNVRVCEAIYPFGRALTVAGGPTLPVVRQSPARVAVFGDSGCKPKDQSGCTLDDPAWPLPQLAASAAKNPPDLVVHVGDYNYRGTPSGFTITVDGKQKTAYYYDAGDGAPVSSNCGLNDRYLSQNSSGNPQADSWQPWWLDFFQPAGALLSAAPWVFVRGNHELCSHAGPGFFYFLDGSTDLLPGPGQRSCPPQDPEGPVLSHLLLLEPQVLKLGQLELLVLDSANACDQLPGLADTYRRQLQEATRRLEGHDAWLLSHRPIWGIEDKAEPVYDCDSQLSTAPALPYGQLNQSLQCALRGETGAALLPRLSLILAGHMHRFETLSFAAPTRRPPTLVVGNSGVFEDSGPPTGAFAQTIDGGTASGFSLAQFGYLELFRTGEAAWQGKILAVDPAAWAPYVAACGGEPSPLCVQGLP